MSFKSSLRVLNLEDNVRDAELNEAMLSARWPDCKLTRVDTREDFIDALEVGGFDVILSDYTMPTFDGRAALALAHEKCPDIPFLFVSGTIGEDTAIEALKNGATDYILKHRPLRLIPAVDRALREAAEREERKQARDQEAVCFLESTFRKNWGGVDSPVFLTSALREVIVGINDQAEALLGCTRMEILGRKLSQFLVPGNGGLRGGDQGGPGVPPEHMLLCADGSVVPVKMRTIQLNLFDCTLTLRFCQELKDLSRPPESTREKSVAA